MPWIRHATGPLRTQRYHWLLVVPFFRIRIINTVCINKQENPHECALQVMIVQRHANSQPATLTRSEIKLATDIVSYMLDSLLMHKCLAGLGSIPMAQDAAMGQPLIQGKKDYQMPTHNHG